MPTYLDAFRPVMVAILLGVVFFAGATFLFTLTQSVLIGLIVFLVTLWTNEALPLGAVSLLPLILFPAFGVLDLNSVAPNYSKSIIFLFLGGFMLAIAIEKIKLHEYFSAKLLSFFPNTRWGSSMPWRLHQPY